MSLKIFKENLKDKWNRNLMITLTFILFALVYSGMELKKQEDARTDTLRSGIAVCEDEKTICFKQIGNKGDSYFFVYKYAHDEYLVQIIKASRGI